ncbi:MAG: alpha-glucan family phosphorylase [Cytophagales bacterium]|nr:alpha-glucan family phosphorylase [Cytophagales bacterium]
MNLPEAYQHPYEFDPKYSKSVVYFSMEFAIDQALKIYSGGLGFLAGSHMRSAYELKQNTIGIGILWKYGYYDQVRKSDQSMDSLFQEKSYSFLKDTKIKFKIEINGHPVAVKAFFLPPKLFNTVPMFFLSTDLPENDFLAQSTCHRLYDSDPSARIGQSILLGIGGAKLLDKLGYEPEIYHLNEAHALPAAFYLYNKYKDAEKVRSKMVFTTHTPEEAGNEKHDISLLNRMSFFCSTSLKTVRKITGIEDSVFNHSLAALRLSHIANGVSKLHGKVSREMWKEYDNICPILHVTNAQNKTYWADPKLEKARKAKDSKEIRRLKRKYKEKLFRLVADQTGKMFDPDVLTIVWARRYAEYKRADLITKDASHFHHMLKNSKQKVQIIWAGKPYPFDYNAVHTFNGLVRLSKNYKNMAVLTGYELELSRLLKLGSDVWLNNPRITREASGTSGMTAAMNASVNISSDDGWIPEFARNGKNSFVLEAVDHNMPKYEQDLVDLNNLFEILEGQVIPTYYEHPKKWSEIVLNSMDDVAEFFDSGRMVGEYYDEIYSYS